MTYSLRAVGVPARQAGTPCWNSVFDGTDFRGLAADNANVSLCWRGGDGATSGGGFLNNHNWVEWWDSARAAWVHTNVPPSSAEGDTGLCANFSAATGCGYAAADGCASVAGGPGAAMRDHEIFATTWAVDGDADAAWDQPETLLDAATLRLSDGTDASPLVWANQLRNALGQPLKDTGLRLINRTDTYRCKD